MRSSKKERRRMKTFLTDPTKVKVRKGLTRYRQDMKKINKLRESLDKFGQLSPIIVTEDMELVAGGRRLAACLLDSREVLCVKKENLSDFQMREIELEENIQREDLTPAEEVKAVNDLHLIKQEIHGETQSGREGGWTLENTAESIGKTKGSVIDSIALARAVEEFPELMSCKTKSDIRKAAGAINRVQVRAERSLEYSEKVKKEERVFISHSDAEEHMKTIPEDFVDLLIFDPLYEINADEIRRGIGRDVGAPSVAGYKIEDKRTDFSLVKRIAMESTRFCKSNAHLYVFVAPEHFETVRNIFALCSWDCHSKPIIWYKPNAGQTNQPFKWPSSSYEMILYGRRNDSKLVKLGQNDVLTFSAVTKSSKLHDYEKPVPLLEELILRTSFPGSVLYDPCAGSGSSIVAGMRCQLISYGCEINKDAYNAMLERIAIEKG